MSGVLAVALTAVALPPLVARAAGGEPPDPYPRLAALAPLATLVAFAGVAVAAAASWWLALLLSIPALILLAWQLPPARRTGGETAPVPEQLPDPAPGALTLRVLTLNVLGGSADPAAVVRAIERHRVDVLVVQELTPGMVHRLADAGIDTLLPYCHLDPRPKAGGTGLWARWPLAPLPPVPGLKAAAPRARIQPVDGWPVTVTGVHPKAPVRRNVRRWQQELAAIRSTLVRQRRAAGGCGGLQRQPGPPAVPGPAGRRFPGLRRRRPAAPVAGLHLASRPVDPVGHAAGPRARFPGQRHGERVTGHPGSRYRPPGGSCGYPADVSATTSHRSSSEAFSSWIARSCAPSSISFS